MATGKDFIAYLQDCLRRVPDIHFRAMFGEYAMYAREVVVALVCDQTMFVKVTEGTSTLLADRVGLGYPYPGAKPAYALTEAELEDDELMPQVIAAALRDLAGRAKPAASKRAAKGKTPAKKKRAAAKKQAVTRKKAAIKPGGKPARVRARGVARR
jgi:TfoX/Sxy family transcriptional regulator of competence genes